MEGPGKGLAARGNELCGLHVQCGESSGCEQFSRSVRNHLRVPVVYSAPFITGISSLDIMGQSQSALATVRETTEAVRHTHTFLTVPTQGPGPEKPVKMTSERSGATASSRGPETLSSCRPPRD